MTEGTGWGSGWDNQVVSLVIIDASGLFTGLFVYDPAPALGTLVASIAAENSAPGQTDPFGNAWLAGHTAYQNRGGTFFACSVQSGQVSFQTAPAAGGPYTVRSSMNGSNTVGQMTLAASPLLITGFADPLVQIQNLSGGLAAELLQLSVAQVADLALGVRIPADTQSRFLLNAQGTINWSPNGDGTGQVNMVPSKVAAALGLLTVNGLFEAIASSPSSPVLIVQNQSAAPGNPALQVIAQLSGDNAFGIMANGDLFNEFRVNSDGTHLWGTGAATQDTRLYRGGVATLAADTILANISGSAEVWHSLGTPGITGWTSNRGRYRIANDGCVEFDISLASNGAAHASSITTYPNTLPAAYTPAFNRPLPLGIDTTITAGDPYPRLAVLTTGAVRIGIPSVGASVTEIAGTLHMPLD